MAKLSETFTLGGGVKSTAPKKLSDTFTLNPTPQKTDNATSAPQKLSDTFSLRNTSVPAPVGISKSNNVTPIKVTDTIRQYESIDDHNILERAFSKSARNDYNKKQSLQAQYEVDKDNQVRAWLKNKGLTANDVVGMSLYSDAKINKMLEGKGFSKEQIKAINDYADRQRNAYNLKNIEDFGEEHKVAGTLLSVPTNLIGGVDTAIESGLNYIAGKPISTTTNANFVSDVTDTLRDKATENMGVVGKTLYGAGTSVADMGLAALTGGAYVMGLEKAGSTMKDAAERGLNPTQTIAEGLASGITTAITEGKVFENIGESLTKGIITKEGESAIKAIAKQILKTGLMEGGQEVAEGSLDILSDQLIANLLSRENKSSLNQDYQAYLKSGMSKDEAVKAVIGDTIKSGVADFVGGFLAGGVAKAPAIAFGQINTADERRTNREAEEAVQGIVERRRAMEEAQRVEESRQNRFEEERRANQNELPYLLETARAQAEAEAREAQERADRREKLDNDFNAFLEEQRISLDDRLNSVESGDIDIDALLDLPVLDAPSRADYVNGTNPFELLGSTERQAELINRSRQDLLNGGDGSVDAGKATHIQIPYNGETPAQYIEQRKRIKIPDDTLADAQTNIGTSTIDSKLLGTSKKRF